LTGQQQSTGNSADRDEGAKFIQFYGGIYTKISYSHVSKMANDSKRNVSDMREEKRTVPVEATAAPLWRQIQNTHHKKFKEHSLDHPPGVLVATINHSHRHRRHLEKTKTLQGDL
jgi:hypothetical protein